MRFGEKGGWAGPLHTALDFIPFVGMAKNLAEIRRGRDFFPDKRPVAVPEPPPVAAFADTGSRDLLELMGIDVGNLFRQDMPRRRDPSC